MTNRPTYAVVFSARSGKKGAYKYHKGHSLGLFVRDSGPVASGSASDEYLAKLAKFVKAVESKGHTLQVALFKNSNFKKKTSQEYEEEKKESADEEESDESGYDL